MRVTSRVLAVLVVVLAALAVPAAAMAAKAVKPTYSFSKGSYSGPEPANSSALPQQVQIGITRNPIGSGNVDVTTLNTGGTATGGSSCATAGVDYISLTSQTATFYPNNAQAFVYLQVCPDLIYEGPETLQMILTNPQPTGTGLGSKSKVTMTINDNDAAPKLTITGDTTTEGDGPPGQLLFTVAATGASQKDVKVNFATSDGPAAAPRIAALAGEDYTANSGTLTFPGDSTGGALPNQQFRVQTKDDGSYSNGEQMTATLSMPVNATLGTPSSALGKINEFSVKPTVSFGDAQDWEGATLAFPVTLDHPTEVPLNISFRTDNINTNSTNDPIDNHCGFDSNDLVYKDGVLALPLGTTNGGVVHVDTCPDALVESNEVFKISPFQGTPDDAFAGAFGTGTIRDDDAATLTLADDGATTGTRTFTALVSNQAGNPLNNVLVRFEVFNGAPFSFLWDSVDIGGILGVGSTSTLGNGGFDYTGNGTDVGGLNTFLEQDGVATMHYPVPASAEEDLVAACVVSSMDNIQNECNQVGTTGGSPAYTGGGAASPTADWVLIEYP